MNVKETYDKIKDMNVADIRNKIASGEIEIPAKGADRDEFLKFASSEPGSDTRKQFLGTEIKEEPVKSDEDKPAVPVETPEPKQEINPKPEPPVEKSDEDTRSWWEKLGYETADEAVTAHTKLRDVTSEQQRLLDRYNAERGKEGQEKKKLKERLDALEKERKELAKGEPPKAINLPKLPVFPDAEAYEDGIVSEEYQKALKSYSKQIDAYNKAKSEADSALMARIDELNKKILDIEPAIKNASDYVQDASERTIKSEYDLAWDKVWSTAEEVQKTYDLGTTVKIRDISDAYKIINDPAASQIEKSVKKDFISSLPKSDIEKYDKTRRAIEAYFHFSPDQPPVAKYRKISAALVDTGLIDQFKVTKKVELTPEEEKRLREEKLKQDAETVTLPSSAQISSNDTILAGARTPEENVTRFKELVNKYNKAVMSGRASSEAFEASPEFKEYVSLRSTLGIRVPNFKHYQ